jgi:hypothetical protein
VADHSWAPYASLPDQLWLQPQSKPPLKSLSLPSIYFIVSPAWIATSPATPGRALEAAEKK